MLLVFSSHNQHKIVEINKVLPDSISVIGLQGLKITDEIPETGSTLEENALIKARYISLQSGLPCFADDSGLEVEMLNGAPGVFSARYAGEPKSDEKNTEKLLLNLSGEKNRNARFRTIIALIKDGKEYLFEGMVKGTISTEKRGTNGFGYDPVFIPDGYDTTFAEMTLEEKNKISHRAIAVQKLVAFLRQS